MKIINEPGDGPVWRQLRNMRPGRTFRLKRRLSRDTEVSDPFLYVDLQSYTLYSNQHECCDRNKFPVLNLRNNRLSYIDGDREVVEVNVTVGVRR